MNIVTKAEPTTEMTPDENKNAETGNQPQLVHIIFQDKFGSDQHVSLLATPESNVSEDDENYEGKKARARKDFEDRVISKAQIHLSRKKADMATVTVLTQAEWEQSQEAGKKCFYVLYRNGTRRFANIRAENKAAAAEIFSQRISETWPKSIFTSDEFKPLRENGGWRSFTLPEISPN